tara:strand:+ start:3947 stop:6001 length:2055 start_codon:yes stop_codon:yes gene_type:complete
MEYINRTTNKFNNKYKVYPKNIPINYKRSDGGYEPIDLSFKDASSNIGDIKLNSKNIFSIGVRKDKNPYKFSGIRPDIAQDGSKQIEFTINNVKINNVDGYDIEDFSVSNKLNSFMKLYKNNGFKDFELEFKIHLTGLDIVNDKYKTTTKLRNSLTTEFINAGQDTGTNLINTYLNDSNIDTSNSHMKLYVGQVTDDFFIKFDTSNNVEFGDNSMDSYSFYDMLGTGSTMYLKDCLVFYAVGKNIDNFNNSILKNICNKYNLSLDGDLSDQNRYFFKDGKKVGSYICYENKVLGHINTKAISETIKSLYIRKTFDITSHIDLSLNQFEIDMREQFNYNVNEINVDNNYYEGTKFLIKVGNQHYCINTPLILDKDYNVISDLEDCLHTLKDNGDNTYTYTKYLSIKGLVSNIGNSVNYIDARVDFESSPHMPLYSISSEASQTHLNTMRDATTGTGSGLFFSSNTVNATKSRSTNSQGSSSTFSHQQGHFIFDTSSVSAADSVSIVSKAKFNGTLTGTGASYGTYSGIRYQILKSTATLDEDGNGTPNETADIRANYNEIDGHTSSWSSSDVTEYTDAIQQIASSVTSYTDTTNTINSTGVTDIINNNEFKVCFVEHDEYYGGTLDTNFKIATSGSSTAGKGIQHILLVNETFNSSFETSDILHLEVTTSVSTPTDNATFFGANF